MNPHAAPTQALGPWRVRTVNVSTNRANKIHEDATAVRYGFRGGLVDGTLIYAHLTTPLVERLGAAWLDASVSELKLLQPAYDGDWLTVTGEPLPVEARGPGWRLSVRNESDAELAVLETRLPPALPPVDARAGMTPAPADAPVMPISWDALRVNDPLRALRWSPSAGQHDSWCERAREPLALYREGAAPRLHPGLVLQAANDVFSHHYRLEPWLHTASRIVQRGPLRLGDAMEVRAVPIAKWERKGHQFVTLYVVLLNAGAPTIEVQHTAIFRVRPRPG